MLFSQGGLCCDEARRLKFFHVSLRQYVTPEKKNPMKQMLPVVVIVLAMGGFMVTSYLTSSSRIEELRGELEQTRKSLVDKVDFQQDVLRIRENAIISLAEDMVKQREMMIVIDKQMSDIRDETRQNTETLQSGIGNASQENARRIDELEKGVKGISDLLMRLQQDLNALRALSRKYEKELMQLREEILMEEQPPSSSNHGGYAPAAPASYYPGTRPQAPAYQEGGNPQPSGGGNAFWRGAPSSQNGGGYAVPPSASQGYAPQQPAPPSFEPGTIPSTRYE